MTTRGCQRCGQCGCNCGVLPYAADVILSGLQNQTRAMQCHVQFDACFGEGVEAVVVSPGGCPEHAPQPCAAFCPEAFPGAGFSSLDNSGPVSGVVLISGGSCYARVGRNDPTGSVAARAVPLGNAPPMSVELRPASGSIPENTETARPLLVAHIVVRDDGRGTNALSLSGPDVASFEIVDGALYLKAGVTLDFEWQAVYSVTVNAVDASVPASSPATATFTLTLTDDIDEPGDEKEVPAVVTPPVPPLPGVNPAAEEATFTITFERHVEEPVCTSLSSGACMPESLEMPETPYWSISSIEVNNGTHYAGGELVSLAFADGVIEEERAIAKVVANADGIPIEVEIIRAGRYYKENRDPEASIISPVWGCVRCKVAVSTFPDPDGALLTVPYAIEGDTGARIRGVVDGDPANKTFGEIIGLEVVAAGDKAIGWRWARSCASLLNGKPITVFGSGDPLVSFELDSCYGKGACIVAEPAPSRYEPGLIILGEGNCHTVVPPFNTPAPVYGCGGSIEYSTQKFLENDDPTRPYWSVVSVDASGGASYLPNRFAHVFVHNPVTNRPLYQCPVVGDLPQIVLQATAGVLTGATIVDGGKFWLERPYAGEPVPIERIAIESGGGSVLHETKLPPEMQCVPAAGSSGSGYEFVVVLEPRDGGFGIEMVVPADTGEAFAPYATGPLVAMPVTGTIAEQARLLLVVDAAGVPIRVDVLYPGKFWTVDVEQHATLYAKLGRVAPTLSLQQSSAAAGVGATLAAEVAQAQDECKVDYWYIESASVTGGQGYKAGDKIVVVPSEGDTVYAPARLSLEVDNDGVPSGVKVAYGGKYWRESKSAAAYVTDFTVVTRQLPPSIGVGADIGVTIDSDPDSETFGQVTAATIKSGGQGYTLAGQFGCLYEAKNCDVTVSVAQESVLLSVTDGIASGTLVGAPIAANCSEWESQAVVRNGLNAGAEANVVAPAAQIPSCAGPPACYERCPDLRLLCIVAVVTTPLGVVAATSQDFVFVASAGRISAASAAELSPPPLPPPNESLFLSASVTLECEGGVLRISGGWAGLPAPECFCTSAVGCVAIPCGEGNWWEGEFAFPLLYNAGGGGCGGCPAAGSVQVTISTPEGVGPPC